MLPRATELEYLRWFYQRADFGPAHEDVVDRYNQAFIKQTGHNLPEGYNIAPDGETCLDQ